MNAYMTFPKTLVVEDNSKDAFLLLWAFRAVWPGATVHLVSDGVEAIDYLRGKQLFDKVASVTLPDLLLLDWRTPRLNGFGVLTWLRMHPHLRPEKVAVFGASLTPADGVHAQGLGADYVLCKPEPGADFISFLKELAGLLTGHTPPTPVTASQLPISRAASSDLVLLPVA
jgi:CheY-like chemotaxis protein